MSDQTGAAGEGGNALDAASAAAAAAAAGAGNAGQGGEAAKAADQKPGGEGGEAGKPDPNAWRDSFKDFGLPDHLYGADAGETAIKVAEDWKKQRETLSKRDYAGKSVDDYKIELTDDVKAIANIADDDPIYKQFRQYMMDEGVPAQNANRAVSKFVTHLVETGVIEKPMTVEQMMLDIDKLTASGTAQEKRAATNARLTNINVQLGTMVEAKTLTKAEAQELRSLSTTGVGVAAIEKLLGPRAGGLQLGGRAAPVTQNDIQERQKDPRYMTTSPKYDKAFREETDKMAQEFYGARR